MKRKILMMLNILCIAALVGCNTDSDKVGVNENIETVESNSEDDDDAVFEYTSGDDYINQLALDTVKLEDDEEISDQEWVDDSNTCYRVTVRYITAQDNAYRHKRDYFLFTDESVEPVIVDYPDKDDTDADRYVYDGSGFEAYFEDVTFDGNDDLLISLGGERSGASFYCVYVYDEGQYEYIKSFEQIANYKLDYESNRVVSIQGDSERSWAVYYEYNEDTKIFEESELTPHTYETTFTIEQLELIEEELTADYYDNFIFSTENGDVTVSEEDGNVKVEATVPTDTYYGYIAVIEDEELVSITFNDGTIFSFGDEDVAELEFDEYMASLNISGWTEDTHFGWNSMEFDVSGDGCNDLIRFHYYGSGIPKAGILVYDPVNHTGYLLESDIYSYCLESYGEDELLIRKYVYQNSDKYAIGTLAIEDNELVWVER